MKIMTKNLDWLFSSFFVLGVWEVLSRIGLVNFLLFPPPSVVASALFQYCVSGVLFSDLGSSLWRLLWGMIIGSFTGIFFGFLTGRINIFARILEPIIQVFRSFPPVAIIPLVIVWFGIGDGAKIFSISFAVFFPVWLNTHLGARDIPQSFLWSASLLTRSKAKIFRSVVFPAVLPNIIAGIRTSIAVGFIMVFVSELAGASSGLGYRISITQLSYRTDEMIAGLFVLGLLGALTDRGFTFVSRRCIPFLKHIP